MKKSATDKRILITAGSSWVALDKVRIIGNTASGKTGLILAEKLKNSGAKVTLLLGPGEFSNVRIPGVKTISFRYFPELKSLLSREIKKKAYSAVIHAAAVSDYRPGKAIPYKVSSQLNRWKIILVPTEKLIDSLKKYSPGLIAVGFKFEPDAKKAKLLEEGASLLKRSNLDMVVANSSRNGAYQAYILD
ncbi:MAG: phosphopantothenoylcysteine decarboxylase, partial [Candidatus Omnitrophica bacterium]|nr:phosphopantothenoylcysteine decarboxylase [Candidatus Omnitrophota bacterium]